jgi:2-amino-4-hydroxy-6-hydroxymethyldihydropteridine diphosphokinase
MRETYLGLGTNIGDREKNLIEALKRISALCPILDYSSLYNTAPVGYTEQADFLNMVVKIDASGFSPHELLRSVKSIERSMGRKDTVRWGPRVIDIDILYSSDIQWCSEQLSIPHKELLNRLFVLVPLSELTGSLTFEGDTVHFENRIRELTKDDDRDVDQTVTLYKSRGELEIHGQRLR